MVDCLIQLAYYIEKAKTGTTFIVSIDIERYIWDICSIRFKGWPMSNVSLYNSMKYLLR